MAKAKDKIVKINQYDSFLLEPAHSRTYYDHSQPNRGGMLFAYKTKASSDCWFVRSRINGKLLGVVEESTGDEFTFVKVRGDGKQITPALKAKTSNMIGTTYYELEAHSRSASTLEGVIAYGLSIEHRA